MIKVKNILSFLMLIGLLFLVACGGSSDSAGNTQDNANDQNKEEALPEGYPNKTMEVLVGYGAGGGTDISARKMVEALNEGGIVEQAFVVENMEGAGGALAMRELGKRKGDIYTLEAIPEYGSGLWNDSAGGLTLDDFTPIAQVATDYQIICVGKDSPYETIEDLLDAMKKDPQSVTISSASSLDGGEAWRWYQIADAYGIEGQLKIVPLEGGNAALTALLGGDADATFVVPQLAADHVEKGNIKPLAVLTNERTEQFPDVPTLKEKGIDATYYRSRGFWMSGDVPEAVADYWENALKDMFETDLWKNYVADSGLLLEFKGRDEYRADIEKDGKSYQEYFNNLQK